MGPRVAGAVFGATTTLAAAFGLLVFQVHTRNDETTAALDDLLRDWRPVPAARPDAPSAGVACAPALRPLYDRLAVAGPQGRTRVEA